ncbi:class D sortase, partial [Alicyclobacillaceae bacterium I2511]
GWNYALQTVFINNRSIPLYHPTQVPIGSRVIHPVTRLHLWSPLPTTGTKIGELSIPAAHILVPVVQGTGWNQLGLGVGHDVASVLPGQMGDVYLAGHRDTVFLNLRKVRKGDRITLATVYGKFVYEAISFSIVPQTDLQVLRPTSYSTLTLQTCYPFFFFGFAPDRYLVHTKLLSQPLGIQ